MKYSKKKYLDYLVRTIDALNAPGNVPHIFINNPGFGNIFDILKNESYRTIFIKKLDQYYGEDYTGTIINSLKKSSLNSYYTPEAVVDEISKYISGLEGLAPRNILEPSAGNGLFIRALTQALPESRFTAFEKEILTVRILEHNFKFKANVTIYGIPFENLAQTDAAKSYDLAVSNIPFGANKIFDTALAGHPLRSQISLNIHSYFVYKSLACLKPAGISVLICTKNFMDKSKYVPIRKYLMESNNFIGGIRLPDTAFVQENTSIVSDILIFQNNRQIVTSIAQRKTNALFTQTTEQSLGENLVQMNEYFLANPNYVLGKIEAGGLYNNLVYTVKNLSDIEMLARDIGDRLNGFQIATMVNKSILKSVPIVEVGLSIQRPEDRIEPVVNQGRKLGPGNLVIKYQKVYKINAENDQEQLQVKPREFDRLSKILALRDTYFKLLDSTLEDSEKLREELDYQYEAFCFQYGQLHESPNYTFVTLDIQGPMVLGLEIVKDGLILKSDIFTKTRESIKEKIQLTEVPKRLPLEDAIYLSMNKFNRIEVDTLVESTGRSKDTIIKESLERQLLFLDPGKDGWELTPKFLFLSGIIYQKLDAYRKDDFGDYRSYVDKTYVNNAVLALERIKPPVTPFEDLDIKLHEPWFSIEFTQAFLHDTYNSLVNIAYNESTSKYMVKIEKADYEYIKKFTVRTEHRYYNFQDILEGALNSTIPYVSKGSGQWKRTDKAKMQEIRIKFDLMYSEFNAYIVSKPDLKQKLEDIFYNAYDAQVHPKYDGDYLKFEGLRYFEPYKSQKDTVAGIIINQGLLVNKEVGFGKTLDIALTTLKLKELGLSKRTLVICLGSTVVQLERELLNAFPAMRLLVAHDKVINGIAKRNAFFKKICNSNYDVVLMSHDTFKFIPQSPEVTREVIEEELANLERDLSVIYQDRYNINKRELKGSEQRKENLEVTLKQVYFEIGQKQSDAVSFDTMGFEHIMVDESHKFKILMYTTRHNRVAGLNTAQGAERSKNLFIAIRSLQRKKGRDFQATFLSGTPISNSITEVYILFKYLIPYRMEQMNITSFDQWAQVFANKSYEFEPTISGDYKVRERFRSFKKMKLLSSLYNEISIIVNGRTHYIDRPKMELDVHTLKPTRGQLEYFERIREFLRLGDSSLLYGDKYYSDDQKSALSLIALHHMRNASIDPRLLGSALDDPGEGKLRKIAAEVYATYKDTEHFKGTQAIFSDLGVPKGAFNVYDELKRILVKEFDIPEREIVFIHDFKTDTKRLECYKNVNAGNYRIIIGSTEKLGTGTNIQERVVRIHHVDIPHRPTDIDQRNGRGVRKGNEGAKKHFDDRVIVSFYIVKNCTDALMLNNVNIKKNFIEQLTNGTMQFNKLDMGPVNDDGTIDYKTLLAVAKNDPLYLEKENLSKQLDDLALERSILKKNQLEAHNNIAFFEAELTKTSQDLQKLEKDIPLWNNLSDKEKYFKRLASALNLKPVTDRMVLGQNLDDRLKGLKTTIGEHAITIIENARLILKVENETSHSLTVVTPNGSYGYGSKKIVANLQSLAEYIYNSLSKIPKALETQKELVNDLRKSIKANQKILEIQFEKSDQLELVEKRLVEINTSMDEKYDVEPAEKEESNTEVEERTSSQIISSPNNISM